MYPLNTVLDDSIGCAVWFAARGQGILGNGPDRGKSIVSTSRVGTYVLCVTLKTVLFIRGPWAQVMRKPAFCICENKDADRVGLDSEKRIVSEKRRKDAKSA